MAMNLYNKYRPKQLSSVSGHKKILEELKKRFKENKFPNVMYFTGQTGTGKSVLARIVGKAILCQNKDKEGNPCDKCESCNTINNEVSSSYWFELNASNLNIDEMRNIEDLSMKSSLSDIESKVFFIDELQELSRNKAAMKNLLKLIERPNPDVYFIFASMDDSKVESAVKNRAVQYILKDLEIVDVATTIRDISMKEGCKESEEFLKVLIAIAENSGGSLRTAISYLERVIESDIQTSEELVKELSLVSTDLINVMINDLLSGNPLLLSNKIDEKILDSIKYKLSILFKASSGVDLNQYEGQQIKGISKVEPIIIQNALEELFELQKFPYLTQLQIDFVLLKILNKNKNKRLIENKENKIETKTEEVVKVRQRVKV